MRYAILNGLRWEIATYVTQQHPTNIDQLLAEAKVAEPTMPAQSTHDSALHAKVDRLVDSWEKMSVNPIRDNRSTTPTQKQVTFTPPERQSPTSQPWTRRPFRPNSPYPRAQFTEQTGSRFGGRSPERIVSKTTTNQTADSIPTNGSLSQMRTYSAPSSQLLSGNQSDLPRCGKRGHFAAVCRSRTTQQGPRTFKYE